MQRRVAGHGSSIVFDSSRRRRPSGSETNRCHKEDRPIHEWYRFVLSFPPHLVRSYLDRFQVDHRNFVLDPFCGTGTTLVECKKLGIPSVGIEANPVAHLATQVKTSWDVNAKSLLVHAQEVVRLARQMMDRKKFRIPTLTSSQQTLLIRNSISPVPLRKALILRSAIDHLRDSRFSQYEQLALAKQAVSSFSNLHFGPEVGVSRNKTIDAPVFDLWLDQLQHMASDLDQIQLNGDAPAKVYLGDARNISKTLAPNSIDTVITSPPYPNEKDYSRTTRLESVLLGLLTDKMDLRRQKKTFLRSNTRNVYKGDDDTRWIRNNTRVTQLADRIENRRIELGKTSGFERQYHRVVRLYFGGMARHLRELAPKLKTGARLAYVVGDQASYFRILIRTGEILGEIAEEIGYVVDRIDLFRTRLSTVSKNQLREEVMILRWPGTAC